MTAKERASSLVFNCEHPEAGDCSAACEPCITQAITAAVEEEREACAGICDASEAEHKDGGMMSMSEAIQGEITSRVLGRAIRARKEGS